jgi:hypothetical protein
VCGIFSGFRIFFQKIAMVRKFEILRFDWPDLVLYAATTCVQYSVWNIQGKSLAIIG